MNGLINNLSYFDELKYELLNNWQFIDKKFIFPTPIDSNIISFSLTDGFDFNFTNTKKILKEIKNVGGMYVRLYIYPPYTRTTFHRDAPEFRYVFPIVSNHMCFNYELKNQLLNQSKLTEEFFKIQTDTDLKLFNDDFLKNENSIYVWKPNNSYLIGTNAHAHLNFSDENRIVIVFDHRGKLF